jgi:hypothetical protein
MTTTAAAKAARLTTKADASAADRLLKRAIAATTKAIRAGVPREDYVATLITATTAADLLLEG